MYGRGIYFGIVPLLWIWSEFFLIYVSVKIMLLILRIMHKLGLPETRMALSKFIGTKTYGLKGYVRADVGFLRFISLLICWILSFL